MTQEQIDAVLVAAAGQRAWGGRPGHGSMWTIELGDPRPADEFGVVYGAFHLWIQDCAWRIDGPDGVVLGSQDDLGKLGAVLNRLEDTAVSAISAAVDGALAVSFDNGLVARTFMNTSDEENWTLKLPDNRYITGRAGGGVEIESSSA